MSELSPLRIETERLVLGLPPAAAAPRLVAYFQRNQSHLAPWEPRRTAEFFTETWWARQLEQNQREFAEARSMRLVLSPREDEHGGPVVGVANFTSIVRGPFQASLLGYSLDAEHEGRGLMFEALRGAIDYAFGSLQLHRVMANYQPQNERSADLLARLGFEKEGFARDYLYLDGAWRDHVLTALTNPAWRE